VSAGKVLVAVWEEIVNRPKPTKYDQTPKGTPRRTSKGALTNQIAASLKGVKFLDDPRSAK
jgi:hypothetical protein